MLLWIPKEKFAAFEKKVNELDPENVSARLREAVEEIENFKKRTKDEVEQAFAKQATNVSAELKKALEKTVSEKIESFSGQLKEIVKRKGEEQDKKINEFISSSRKTVQIIWSQISEAIKNALGPILAENPEKAAGPEKGKGEGAKG